MERYRVGLIVMAITLLSHGELVESTETGSHGCFNADVFLSYLDLERYNTSNPYIEFDRVMNQMLDLVNKKKPFSDYIYDLAMCWIEVCKAEDVEKEKVAWKDLAKEIHHRFHSDESMLIITEMIFGEKLVPWIMKPPHAVVVQDFHIEKCVDELAETFVEHCGMYNSFGLKYISSFYAMCSLGVRYDEFVKATRVTCRDYVYTPNPILGY